MLKQQTNRILRSIRPVAIATVASTAMLAGMTVNAEPPGYPYQVHAFDNERTSAALNDGDFESVIESGERSGPYFGFRDIVNLCAAYIHTNQADRAVESCERAVDQESPMTFSSDGAHGSDRWAAYNNLGVAQALAGDFGAAFNAFVIADRKSGDGQDAPQFNLVIVESARDGLETRGQLATTR